MSIPSQFMRRMKAIRGKCQGLIILASSLHMTSVAKAIEQEAGCRILIKPFPEGHEHRRARGCLVTVDTATVIAPDQSIPGRDHFLYYRPGKAEADRWAVAHELGHAFLHWPLRERICRIREAPFAPHDGLTSYVIEFTDDEESDANAFACVMAGHRPAPGNRPETIDLANIEFEKKVNAYIRNGYFVPN